MTVKYGLVLETPIPLTPMMREAAKNFAIGEYKRRMKGLPSGDRRDNLVKVVELLQKDQFMERAIPVNDFDKESILM